MTGNAETELL